MTPISRPVNASRPATAFDCEHGLIRVDPAGSACRRQRGEQACRSGPGQGCHQPHRLGVLAVVI